MEQATGGYSRFKKKYGLKTATATGNTGGGWSRFKEKYGITLKTPSLDQIQSTYRYHTATPEEREKLQQEAVAQASAAAGQVFSDTNAQMAQLKPILDYQEHLKQQGQQVDTSQLVKGTAEYDAFLDGFYRWQGEKYLADATASAEEKQTKYDAYKNSLTEEIMAAQQSGDPAAVMDAVKRFKEQFDSDSAALEQSYTDNKMSYWANRMNYSDFESKSQYSPKVQAVYDEQSYYKDYLSKPEAERRPIWEQDVSFADALYESVNGNYLMFIKLQDFNQDPMWKKLHKKYQDATTATLQMTQEERQVFNYIFETEGVEQAIEFLNDMAEDLDARFNTYWMQKVAQRAKEDPFWESLGTVAMAPMRAIVGAAGMAEDYLSDGELEKDAWYSQLNRETAVTRGTVGDQIRNSWAGDVGAFLYDAGMSVGDNVMNTVATGGNTWLSAMLTGSDAAVNATDDALQRGLSSDQAMTIGVLSGIGETLMEKVSLGTILDKKMLNGNTLKNLAKGMAVEGLEEVSTELWNTVADVIVSQDKSKWQMAIAGYEEQGLSEGEAFWRAVGDKALELGYNFLSGAAAGGMMSGGHMALNAAQVRQNAQAQKALRDYLDEGIRKGTMTSEQIQGMVNEGLALGKGTESYSLAQKIQKELSKGETPKGRMLAQLVAQSYTDAEGIQGAKPVSIPQIAAKKQAENNPTAGENIQQAAPAGTVGDIDKVIQNSYDNQNTTGGDNNGTRPFDPGIETDRAATGGFERIISETSAEAANRSPVQTGLGANAETSSGIRTDERQRAGLDSQNERFPPHSYIQLPIGSPVRDNQEVFRANGIECRIVAPAYWDRDAAAFTNNGIVYVNPNIDSSTLSTLVPHETCHVMKQNGSAPYMDFILRTPEMLNFKEESTAMLLDLVAEHKKWDYFNLTDEQLVDFYDELNAIVYGMKQAGILEDSDYPYGSYIPYAFYDFEGYISQLDEIQKNFVQTRLENRNNVQSDVVAPEAMDADGGLVPGAAWMKSSTENAVHNVSNNGGNLDEGNTGLLHGEQGRVSGSGTIRQTGNVANGSAETGRSFDQRRTAAERQNLVNAQNFPLISTAELGVTKGTSEKTVRVLPEELWDDALRSTALRVQEKTRKQVTFVVGGLLINGPDGPAMANGIWTENGIVIRADHLRYTIDQIADHEIFHDAAFRTPGLVMSIETEIREKFGDEALDAVVEQYIKALRGIAGIPDGATQEQIDAIAFEILEEIWADAYAGVNRFGAGANQFQNEVSQLLEHVAPMQSMKQDNSAEQPTGPPTDKFSIEEIQGENGVYGQGVVLETTLFDGLKPRQWGEVLRNYVYCNLAGSQITVYDEFNQPETIYFAKANERVKKDGAKNSHKVIDKLARYRGDNVSALGIVHIDELLQTSRYDKSTDEHSHQWMDENGWELRKTYIQESDGTIYEATLNIANGRDRRILYAISNIRQIDKGGAARGDVPSTVSGRGSLTKSNSSNETITDSEHDVKPRFSVDDAAGEGHLLPEHLKDVPMYQPRPKSPYRTDSERAIDTRLVSDAEAHAAAVKGAIFRNIPKEDFYGTDALNKLGVKVDNSVGIYSMVKSMIANDRSAKAVIKALRKAQVRLGATPGERNYASGIADGIYSSSNIPGDMDADKVMELADYYWAVKAITSDQITKQRDSIRQTLQDKIERIMRRVDTTKIKPPRAFTLHHRTAERNMVSIFGPEIGKQLNSFLFDPVAVNEAERYRFLNRMHDTVRKLTGKDGKSKKLNKMERALVQQVIEGRAVEETVAGMEMRHAIKNAAHNIRNGEDAGDAAREFSLNTEERRLAEQYSRWLQTQDALKNDKVDAVRVDNAVQKYSEMFGLFYDAINDFLVAHGYEPIGFIKGYVPHLQPEANQNALSKALEKMGLSKDVSNLPTNIAGLTKNFKPNKRFNPYFLSRHGDVTQYDIVTAFESYVDYMSDVLYHTDDIMRVRQASQYFRKTFAPEENRNRIEQALNLRYGTVESKLEFLRENGEISMFSYPSAEDVDITLEKYLDRLFGNLNDKTVYSDFVMWMDDYANKLAGKQLMTDRDLERTMGRTSLNWVSKLARAFSRAQIAGNLSSALNQTAQLPQVIGENGIKNTAVAVRDFAFCRLKRAGWRQESDFLTEKEGIHYIANTKMDMVVDAAFKPLQWYDGFISTIAVRSKYLKEIQNGASHSEAMKAADKFGRNVMGSRAKGTIPLAFQSKGIVSQFFHLFQVEAANSWEHIVVDLPQDFKEIQKSHGTKAAAGSLAGVIVKTLIAAFLLNRIDEELYGGTPAPYDLLGLTANYIASGQELSTNEFLKALMDNCWENVTGDRIFDTDDDSLHDGKFNWGGAFEDTLYNVTNDIPYLRNAAALLGLGDETLPIPDLAGSAKDIVDAISDEGLISYDMGQALLGIAGDILPGGRQIEKTVAGIETAIRGGKYKGTGDNSKLQYPVDVNPWTALRLALFGDAAASERNQFYASGDSALSEKQTSVYQSLVNQGAYSKELYAAIQDYREVSNDDSLSSVQRGKQCRDIIRSLDMSDELKLEMYEGMTGAKSTVESFRILMDAGLGWNDVMDVYDKYSELKANKELRPQEQTGIFAKWVDQQKYSSNQRVSIKEQLLFWNMYPAQAAQYEEFVELGLCADDAYELAERLDDLEPESGTDKVTDVQRWRTCVEFSYKPATQLAALAGVMDDGQLLKARIAFEMNVNPDTYVTLKERLPEYDLNHDGSMTNAEVKAAIDSMKGLSYKQKAVLWQLNVNSKSAKNNPYSTVVGQEVLDAKEKG